MLTDPNATEFMTYKQQTPFPATLANHQSLSVAAQNRAAISNSQRP